jgi:DNA-directed RNA polymerase subunit RPC12/RpoP
MSGDWHAVTCDGCGIRKVVKSRGYPHNWRIEINRQGYYEFECPKCSNGRISIHSIVIPENEVDRVPVT